MKNYTNFTSELRAKNEYAHRELITFNEPSAAGEKIYIEISRGTDSGTKASLPRLWYKEGFKDHILPDYWSVSVCAEDKAGICRGKYNPTITADYKVNHAWMNEATAENRQAIIDKVAELAGLMQ